MADSIEAKNPACVTYLLEQCFSGGFIDDVIGTADEVVVSTACRGDEPSYSCNNEGEFDEFCYYYTNALRRFAPKNDTPNGICTDGSQVTPDPGGNGQTSLEEAHDYAERKDSAPESPQYDESTERLGRKAWATCCDGATIPRTCTLGNSGDECLFDVRTCAEVKLVFETDSDNCMNSSVDMETTPGNWKHKHHWNFNSGSTRVFTPQDGTGWYRIVSCSNEPYSVDVDCNDGGLLASDPSSPWNFPGYTVGSWNGSSEEFRPFGQPTLTVAYGDTFSLSIFPRFIGGTYVGELIVSFPFDSIRAGWEDSVRLTLGAVEIFPSSGDYVNARITVPGAPEPGPHVVAMRLSDPKFVAEVNLGIIDPETLNPITVNIGAENGYFEMDGIWIATREREISGVVGPADRTDLPPDEIILSQNRPNPFTAATEIGYALPVPGMVRLVVYDMLGRRVRTLVDEYQAAGHWKVRWNGRNERGIRLAGGVYFYRLEIGTRAETRKMLLLE
jgi:hypothetical protein